MTHTLLLTGWLLLTAQQTTPTHTPAIAQPNPTPVALQETPKASPIAAPVDKAPEMSEIGRLQVENALLSASLAGREYEAKLAAANALMKGAVAAYEKSNPGWTWDVLKKVGVKKAPPKKF